MHRRAFLTLIGREGIANSGTVTNPVERSAAIDDLYKIIADATPSRTTEAWLQALRAIDVPCAQVNRPDDLFDDPHLRAAGFFQEFDHPTEGRLRSTRTPFSTDGRAVASDRPAPRLGRDTFEILLEAGIDRTRIEQLVASGIIGVAARSQDTVD